MRAIDIAELEPLLVAGPPVLVVFETPGGEISGALWPALEALAHEYGDRVRFVRVTEAEQGWLAARFRLAFVPTLVFWKAGGECARIEGSPGRTAIREHLDFLLTGEGRPAPAQGMRYVLQARYRLRGATAGPRRAVPLPSASTEA